MSLSNVSTVRDNESYAGGCSPMHCHQRSNGNHVEGLVRCWIPVVVVDNDLLLCRLYLIPI